MDWLYNLLGTMLKWFTSWTGSYAVALIFYALIFKVLFLPFAIKQQKNQIAMAKLTPKVELIRAKYRGRTDQATMRKQQEEIMELQQKEGYSPLSGCLPMLLQLPIIIFLYEVIRKPLSFITKLSKEVIAKLYNLVNGLSGDSLITADGVGNIDEIKLVGQIKTYGDQYGYGAIQSIAGEGVIDGAASLPNFTLFGVDLSATPTLVPISILVLIPVLAAALQWLTMFITKKVSGSANQQLVAGDNSQQTQMSLKIMDLIFPLLTLWIAFSFSAMMGLYWIYQSIFAIIQTVVLAKLMPIPKFTEEEIKAIRKAQKAQEKAQKEIIKSQPKYKSLHYIDEDDYDELPDIAQKSAKSDKAISQDNKPEIKD